MLHSDPASRTPFRQSLIDLFREFAELPSEFLQYDNGYRRWRYTYAQVGSAARRFAARLRACGIGAGDKVVFWCENRPEWIAAFWGCVLTGAVVVPIDYRASAAFVRRVQELTEARLILIGEEVRLPVWDGQPPAWPAAELEWEETSDRTAAARPAPDDVAEIVFTSGATGEPKGVLITHRNILANLAALDEIVLRYGKWFRPFFPLRFLSMIPLSHMFGQMLTIFFLPLIPGAAVFMRGFSSHEMVRQIRRRKVSVVIAVPKILEVLREHVLHQYPGLADAPSLSRHWTLRWWQCRQAHSLFGWKFWAFAVGAAPLPLELEDFWSRLAFAVIQGYGLTETSPIIAFNNPFELKPGTVGRPIPGMEVRVAPDAEILVRGASVTPGYFRDYAMTAAAFEDGWFHTGDAGGLDEEGHLIIRGRKKEMIVTPEGLNVVPEDVEQVLDRLPGVRESAVVGKDRVHAVLVLDQGADQNEIIRRANQQLEQHQKIRHASIWPGERLPRTESTQKLKHAEIQQWVEAGGSRPAEAGHGTIIDLIHRHAPGRLINNQTTLNELGLSSLDRVELMMDLEQQFDISVDESWLTGSRRVDELKQMVSATVAPGEMEEAEWSRSWWARIIRRIALTIVWLPLTHSLAHLHVTGQQHLIGLKGPVIFASNHQSHLDTPVILAAVPPRYRHRTAVAMWKEYFDAHYFPERHTRREWFLDSLLFWLVTLFFHAFPIPQTETGASQSLRHIGELVSRGWSILLFPEGERTETGDINLFQPGIGLMASRLHAPVVPVRLRGLEKVLHRYARRPHPGPVELAFGPPLHLNGEDYAALARQVEEAVRAL